MCDRGVFVSSTKDLSFVDARLLAEASNDIPQELPDDFQPTFRDVICSRGADSYNHAGNQAFRQKIEEHVGEYARASSKIAKSLIVSAIIDKVRQQGGLFVRQDPRTGKWSEVGDRLAREKAGQAIRSVLRRSDACAKGSKKKSEALLGFAALTASKVTNPVMSPTHNLFENEVFKPDSRLRETASKRSLLDQDCTEQRSILTVTDFLPASLPVSFSSFAARGMSSQTSRTWSAVSQDTCVAVPTLRRSYTESSQLLLDNGTLDEGLSIGPLSRDASGWSNCVDRLPGLLDYDPVALGRMSLDFVSLQSGIPLEIDIHLGEEGGEPESIYARSKPFLPQDRQL